MNRLKTSLGLLILLAGSAISATSRPPERGSQVVAQTQGSVAAISQRTRRVFGKMGVHPAHSGSSSPLYAQTLSGKKKDVKIEVRMSQASANQTRIMVSARDPRGNAETQVAENVMARLLESG